MMKLVFDFKKLIIRLLYIHMIVFQVILYIFIFVQEQKLFVGRQAVCVLFWHEQAYIFPISLFTFYVSIQLSLCLSIHLSLYLPDFLAFYPIYLTFLPSIRHLSKGLVQLPISLSKYLSIHLSKKIYLTMYLSINPSICLSLPAYLSVSPPISLSLHLSI